MWYSRNIRKVTSLEKLIFNDSISWKCIIDTLERVRPMLNLTDFEKKMIKGLFKKKNQKLFLGSKLASLKFFKTKVKDSQYQRSHLIKNKRGKEYEQQL